MMMVDSDELKHLRALERVVLNQLGTTDPRTVAEWIVAAQAVLVPDVGEGKPFSFRPLSLPSHVARCAPTPEPQPQADGEPYTFQISDVTPMGRQFLVTIDGQRVAFDSTAIDEAAGTVTGVPVVPLLRSEQDVIGLLREHTERVEHPLRAVPASVDGC